HPATGAVKVRVGQHRAQRAQVGPVDPAGVGVDGGSRRKFERRAADVESALFGSVEVRVGDAAGWKFEPVELACGRVDRGGDGQSVFGRAKSGRGATAEI